MLTPALANPAIAPVTSSILNNTLGALAVMVYTAIITWTVLKVTDIVIGLRVSEKQEALGLDLAQHGEMLTPQQAGRT
jgi:Amt family ammonium transporter